MDTLFFYASKFIWMIISPDILLVLLLIFALILLWRKSYRPATLLFSISVGLILIITLLPVGDWLLFPLENRFPTVKTLQQPFDGIIVLAGSEKLYTSVLWNQVELKGSAERYFAFIHLMKQYPTVRYLFTGGSGNPNLQEYKSTRVARQLFEEQGIDTSRILFESESRNTWENALFSYRMVHPKPDEHWILVTSASHMARSVGVFTKAGWQVIPYPVDHNTHQTTLFKWTINFNGNLNKLCLASQEWVGLAAYRLTGKTNRLFPGPMQ